MRDRRYSRMANGGSCCCSFVKKLMVGGSFVITSRRSRPGDPLASISE